MVHRLPPKDSIPKEIRDVDQFVFGVDTAYPRLCQTFGRLVMGDAGTILIPSNHTAVFHGTAIATVRAAREVLALGFLKGRTACLALPARRTGAVLLLTSWTNPSFLALTTKSERAGIPSSPRRTLKDGQAIAFDLIC